MKNDANNCAALRIVGNLVVQAATQGDTASMLEHLAVYMAVVKASKEQTAQGRG